MTPGGSLAEPLSGDDSRSYYDLLGGCTVHFMVALWW